MDGKCPDCGRPVQKAKEEAYFFRLSKYQDRLLELFEKKTRTSCEPDSKTERGGRISSSKGPGEDLCISRSTFDWGIPVPVDDKHVIYVWLDALTNYITALGYPDEPALYEKYWPVDVHVVALSQMVRFHCIIWPAMLLCPSSRLTAALPKNRYWVTAGCCWRGGKMSKSKGNVVDPVTLIDDGTASTRSKYFLPREYTFGSRTACSRNRTNHVSQRMNSRPGKRPGHSCTQDRFHDCFQKYKRTAIRASALDRWLTDAVFDDDLKSRRYQAQSSQEVEANMDKLRLQHGAGRHLDCCEKSQQFTFDETMPRVLAKDEAQ